MTKHTMELVWHSCTDCPPEEDYNDCLYVTDGQHVYISKWRKEVGFERLGLGDCDIKPGVNAEGYWWADLHQTVQGFAPIQKETN